ncbi:MAG: hypothetical protein AAF387_22745, partial [Pseudomonadota bacterium]
LFFACVGAGFLIAVVCYKQRHWLKFALFTFGGLLVISPWSVRNYFAFDSFAITGGYGDQTIAYRTAYNRMSEKEWQAAFIYWLPGHGEKLATQFLPKSSYAKLGTDGNSYVYKEGVEIFEAGLQAVNGNRARLTNYLIETEILDKPVAHLLTSIPLAWRGVLTGKYLAVVGLPSLILLLVVSMKRGQYGVVLLAFPALVMVALYAAISVSIPRYNIYLIYYYGVATAWLLVSILEQLRKPKIEEKHSG